MFFVSSLSQTRRTQTTKKMTLSWSWRAWRRVSSNVVSVKRTIGQLSVLTKIPSSLFKKPLIRFAHIPFKYSFPQSITSSLSNLQAEQKKEGPVPPASAAAAAQGPGGKGGKEGSAYVAPALRDGGNRKGETMALGRRSKFRAIPSWKSAEFKWTLTIYSGWGLHGSCNKPFGERSGFWSPGALWSHRRNLSYFPLQGQDHRSIPRLCFCQLQAKRGCRASHQDPQRFRLWPSHPYRRMVQVSYLLSSCLFWIIDIIFVFITDRQQHNREQPTSG